MSDKNENMINESNGLKPARRKKDIALNIVSIICSLAVIILVIIQFATQNPGMAMFYQPLLCVIMLIQAYRFWKTNRGVAILSIAAAALMVIAVLITIFTR